jgi:hypothetical protein
MNTKPLGNGTDPDVTWHDGAIWCAWQEGAALHVVRLDAFTLEETWRATWTVGAPNVYAKLYAYNGQLWLGWREGAVPYRIVLRVIGTTHQEFLDDRGDGADAGHGSHPFIFGGGDVAWQASGAPWWNVWRRALAGGTPRLVRSGVGTGLSRIRGAEIRTVDEDRNALPGYTRPCWAADDVVVAEGPHGGAYARFRDRELTLWPGQTANTPRCAMDGDRLVVVTWGAPHNVRVGVFAYGEMSPIGEESIAPLGRSAFVGGFYATTNKYSEVITDYPQNVEVIVEASAIARARTPVIASPDALSGVADPSNVIGLYVAAEEEGTASALDLAAELARSTWRQHFPAHPVPAIVGYVTRGMAARGTWPPRSVDVFAPECYFDASPSAAGVEALVAGWAHVLTATRPWLLVIQEYDRNGAQRHLMDALAATLPAYLEVMRQRPWVLGLLAFAVNRPGGVRDYPALLAAHRRLFAAVPSAPATLPVAVPPIDPPPDPGESSVMKITVPSDGYAKTGRVGQGAAISFSLQSDVPVTSLTVDFLGDGAPGLTVSSSDMRRLFGVTVQAPDRAGTFQWQLTATNARGERDQTGTFRSIAVQE